MMADPRRDPMELARALSALGERVEFPAQPDLVPAVRAHLEAHPRERPARRRTAWTFERLRPALVAAALVICVAGALLVFSPATRRAVADWIGLDGVRITFDDKPEDVGADLLLGEKVTLDTVQARAGFAVRVPAALGDPDEVYVMDDRPGARVSLLYRATDELPRTDETGVGVLVGQFRATIDREIVIKKIVSNDGFVEEVELAGASGYWLAGGPHVVTYLDENGSPREDHVRLAGNTLLWQRDGVVYRIESSLPLPRAEEIAESMF